MTPLQEKVVKDLKTRVANMRHGNMGDAIISASLISEGWPVGAVRLAMSDIGNPIMEIPPEESGDRCAYLKWPSCPLVDCKCIEAREKLRDTPMTPVSERGMHE